MKRLTINKKLVLNSLFISIFALIISAIAISGMCVQKNRAARLVDEISQTETVTAENTSLSAKINGQALEYAKVIQNVANVTIISIGSLMVIATVLILIVSRKIRESIIHPLIEIEQAATALSKGNLHAEITYEHNDEMGDLATSLRSAFSTLQNYIHDISTVATAMSKGVYQKIEVTEPFYGEFKPIEDAFILLTTNMNETLNKINGIAGQVANGSQQISNTAQTLAQGSTEQASAVEQISVTVKDIAEQVNNNAKSAETADQMAQDVGSRLNGANDQMKSMTEAMEWISQKSTEIGNVIKTIDDIAFQTNILALNAAVEAARAGAAGKGFAVVADEVRNLASKSADAVQSTTALISDSMSAVEKGSSIAKETAASLDSVMGGAAQITTLISDIAKASAEQARAVSQIEEGVEQIAAVVETNSATSQETAASSQELSSESAMLKNMLVQFTLEEETVPSNPSGAIDLAIPNQLDKY